MQVITDTRNLNPQAFAASVYPNPFSYATIISLNRDVTNAYLKVYDINGQVVKSTIFSGNKIMIHKDGLPAGMYFFLVNSGQNNIATGKLIVQ